MKGTNSKAAAISVLQLEQLQQENQRLKLLVADLPFYRHIVLKLLNKSR
jgi:hypothetical protein